MATTFRLEGLQETVANMEELSKATRRNTVRRVLLNAGEPTADLAARLAPFERGALSFSLVVSPQLTSRHRSEMKNRASEVEVYIGPAGGQGALYYAAHEEFGTIITPAQPYLRPAWESTRGQVLGLIVSGLRQEVGRSVDRARRRAARLAARG